MWEGERERRPPALSARPESSAGTGTPRYSKPDLLCNNQGTKKNSVMQSNTYIQRDRERESIVLSLVHVDLFDGAELLVAEAAGAEEGGRKGRGQPHGGGFGH